MKIDVFDWSEEEDSVRARWRFSSTVAVPWRPILAAGGSTTHKFDPETGLVRAAVLCLLTHCSETLYRRAMCTHERSPSLWWAPQVVEHIEAWDTEPGPVSVRSTLLNLCARNYFILCP